MKVADYYIPLQPGEDWNVAGQNDLVNDLLGQVGYVPHDGFVVFTEDIVVNRNTKYVDMQLVVMDFEKYDDYDILPLPADMAADIVTEVFQLLAKELPPDKRVDSVNEENPNER